MEMMESGKERSKQAVQFLFTEAPGRWLRGPSPRESRVPPRPDVLLGCGFRRGRLRRRQGAVLRALRCSVLRVDSPCHC